MGGKKAFNKKRKIDEVYEGYEDSNAVNTEEILEAQKEN